MLIERTEQRFKKDTKINKRSDKVIYLCLKGEDFRKANRIRKSVEEKSILTLKVRILLTDFSYH